MTIRRIGAGKRMSEAVVNAGLVYLAGQVGEGDDITAQTRDVLASIDRVLAEAGTSKSNLLQATVWLADMADFAAMNAVWEAWIDPANPPARATGEVRLAGDEYRIEIIAVAAL